MEKLEKLTKKKRNMSKRNVQAVARIKEQQRGLLKSDEPSGSISLDLEPGSDAQVVVPIKQKLEEAIKRKEELQGEY
jgi:hypothetical protein